VRRWPAAAAPVVRGVARAGVYGEKWDLSQISLRIHCAAVNRGPIGRTLIFIAGSFLFVGCVPRLRGTAGSVAAAAILGLVDASLAPPWWWTLPAAAVVGVAGLLLGSRAEAQSGGKDPSWFVLDEVMGILLAGTGLAVISGRPWAAALCALAAFRIFDGLKPPPIRWIDRNVPGGAGIMADDLAAAVLSWPVAWGLLRLLAEAA
jgi:phosphatidylglycerophosphatase A